MPVSAELLEILVCPEADLEDSLAALQRGAATERNASIECDYE